MKFGREYETALAQEGFPQEWVQSAIQYKYLKKIIKKIHNDLEALGLRPDVLNHFSEWVERPSALASATRSSTGDATSTAASKQPALASISEEFSPQLRILVDRETGIPLDATLDSETRASLRKLAQHDLRVADYKGHLGDGLKLPSRAELASSGDETARRASSVISVQSTTDAQWVTVSLASAKDFFNLLEPKLTQLEALRDAETHHLEEEILDLGDAVENVVEPVREGYEAKRRVSYRDLYFWREMFRLYLEKPIFYSDIERRRGALTFTEAKTRLEEYDATLRSTGLLGKMKTPQAKAAAKQFLDLNVHILQALHFQEMNARAMSKILKKFNKQTHLEGETFLKSLSAKYSTLLPKNKNAAGGFADSIARDLQAEVASKVLAIVPQLDDWNCPVCYSMAWRPVNLGCCRSVFCIRCIIKLQDEGMKRCPMCNAETVMGADGRHIDFETMDFLEKYFPLEVKRRQKENERAQLVRDHGEEFVKPGCTVQ